MDRRLFLKGVALTAVSAASPRILLADTDAEMNSYVKDALAKAENFDKHFDDDIILQGRAYRLLEQVTNKLRRLQLLVGYANFSLLDFDTASKYAASYSRVGEFTKEEKEFLESVFYTNAKNYGFYGEKPLSKMTDSIPSREIVKITGTGHYIFRNDSYRLYTKIRKDIGDSIVLTSGVRGIIKQMHLFLDKAVESQGNLSMASRSLAPPGHSFHGVGDFDVGKRGFGARNFSEDFAQTLEFHRLTDLGYVKIRYSVHNPFGVRYEPWHVKVVG